MRLNNNIEQHCLVSFLVPELSLTMSARDWSQRMLAKPNCTEQTTLQW